MTGVRADALTVTAGDRTLVSAATLEAAPGALTTIVGPNGAGKSSLVRAIAGVASAAGLRVSGAVELGGVNIHALPARERARRLAFVEQVVDVDPQLRVRDIVRLGRTPHTHWWGGSDPDGERAVAEALQRAGVEMFADRTIGSLSGGERQRVFVGRALAQAAAVIVLDEPTSHLDVGAQFDLLDLARTLAREGSTVIAVVHELALAALSDHVVAMSAGRIVAAGPARSTLDDTLVRALYGDSVTGAWLDATADSAESFVVRERRT